MIVAGAYLLVLKGDDDMPRQNRPEPVGVETEAQRRTRFKHGGHSTRNRWVQLCQFIATNAAGLETVAVMAPHIVPPGLGAVIGFVAGTVGMGINQWKHDD